MKKAIFLAALALGSVGAQAGDVIGYLENKVGGRINFTDERQECATGTYYVFATAEDGNGVIEGCWKVVADQARVFFSRASNPVRMYPLANIMVTRYGAANGWQAAPSADERPAPRAGSSL